VAAVVYGANGYIGFAIAQVLRQNGYKVYGVVRNQEHNAKLATHEIIPVLGDGLTPDEALIKKVNIVIDAASDNKASHAVLAATKKHATPHGKKVYIYTSGILVHGPSDGVFEGEAFIDEGPTFAARATLEADIINSKDIHGIVIRPGFVYGYAGGNGGDHLGDKVFQLTDGKIQISGSTEKRWSWVHVHDLAYAFLLAVQKFTIASGQIFDIGQSENPPTYVELRKKAAEIAGHKNAPVVNLPVPDGFWPKVMEYSVRVSSRKANNLLGWYPGHHNILDDLQGVYAAYLAYKGQK